jgi:hypothetical protein
MIVKDLYQMEKIVSKNKTMSWDGWTVVNSFPSEKGRTSSNGAYINGKWCIQNRFVPSTVGWEIPDKFVR